MKFKDIPVGGYFRFSIDTNAWPLIHPSAEAEKLSVRKYRFRGTETIHKVGTINAEVLRGGR